ncbi:hypothetical protein INR49_029812 [Caranx melampygus]|nr:hypothetical protein INR49_029812 [Caranx melampygus]
MASALSSVVFLVLCVALTPCVSGGYKECKSYTDVAGRYHSGEYCYVGFCCAVVATTTHTTVVTSTPQQYPQQTIATPSQPQAYQGAQYPPYQPVPVQQGYGTQPMPQAYGAQPMPTTPYPPPMFTPGPPPTYQEATGPTYPPNPAAYSQAAYNPNQPAYPAQPHTQPQPNAPFAHTDFLSQPAYNPDYVAPKTG